jgi:hypothetical protein
MQQTRTAIIGCAAGALTGLLAVLVEAKLVPSVGPTSLCGYCLTAAIITPDIAIPLFRC